MPQIDDVDIDIADLALTDPAGGLLLAASLSGVHILILMRHRH